MKARFVFVVILLFLLAAIAAVAESPAPASADWRERLREAIVRATSQNPELRALEARTEAARHRVPQATALPDPELEVGIKDIPPSNFSLSRDDFTMVPMVAARQKFPSTGKRGRQKLSAEAGLEAAAAMRQEDVIRVAAEVADSFFAIAELDARIAILERSRERLKRVAASATERYRVGKGAQADVLRANLETTSLEEKLSTLEADRRSEAARFDALQALPANALVPAVELPPAESSVASREDLLREALERSPAVAVAAAEVRKAGEELELARLERRPDFTAMAYYGRRQNFEDLAGASVSFNLPFVQSKRLFEKRAEKEAELSGARADLEAVRNDIRRRIEQAYADLERNGFQLRLYRDSILPQAETNYRAAAEAYAV
ncbi:MAG: TolC family protein, partial [Thermoanaerobaculia bacterium]